ncbi:hypothetical protein SYNPS1DRAFT_31320 [Syncephalis pseudoplumigaleata]|uniref:Uncharacterized protein n=1 Tax=Syncephalis pseudoplumigaleata TaxID=1712513 RepID=A0A4P9YTE6_9FUNG|nr:hypothetical protein SYNPS1DRAFT_31320 [Syncephalis pseudoplumigaleata]|eukprot:RKP22988.1 hypothetical protein SYNPS1DRAFT_31320 [Syncephalis pseudoplumigaleata]
MARKPIEARLQEQLPFYDVDLRTEKPWGTLGSIGESRDKLPRAVKKQQALKRRAAVLRKRKASLVPAVTRQLAKELPFYDVDLSKEQPWGTFVQNKRYLRRQRVEVPLTTDQLSQQLPFYDVDLSKEQPWGTFVQNKRYLRRQREEVPLTTDQLSQQLPFYDVDLSKEQPWGTFVQNKRYLRRQREEVPMTTDQLSQQLPFYDVDLSKEQPWGTFVQNKRYLRRQRVEVPLTTDQLSQQLPFYDVDLSKEQPWGTFVTHIRPRHSVHRLRRARAMAGRSSRVSTSKAPRSSAKPEQKRFFRMSSSPGKQAQRDALTEGHRDYSKQLDAILERVGKDAAKGIHATEEKTSQQPDADDRIDEQGATFDGARGQQPSPQRQHQEVAEPRGGSSKRNVWGDGWQARQQQSSRNGRERPTKLAAGQPASFSDSIRSARRYSAAGMHGAANEDISPTTHHRPMPRSSEGRSGMQR